MLSLFGLLCRARRTTGCAMADRRYGRGNPGPESPPEPSWDDLTVIRGIGIATQNRLNVSGIKSFSQLAKASAEDVWRILGARSRGAKVEDWIAQARRLADKP